MDDTIVALATAEGGALAVIRISGEKAIAICGAVFQSPSNKNLAAQKSHTVHFGSLVNAGEVIDEVLVSVFKKPNSYTGEDVVEVSCHGSSYITQEAIRLFMAHGSRLANPGEFTLRAFLNGKLNLSEAEAVADLIASSSKASHDAAIKQMRGGYSGELKFLRDKLINFASLIELELDFSQEDVEFADKKQLKALVDDLKNKVQRLTDSFAYGNVMKKGFPVAIIGSPNVGKSTLLNSFLKEDRAIVSSVAGTTRDTIEDVVLIDGLAFRFIDTAGIRETQDVIEQMGIQKTYEKISSAAAILYLFDAPVFAAKEEASQEVIDTLQTLKAQFPEKNMIAVANKIDLVDKNLIKMPEGMGHIYYISAKERIGIDDLAKAIKELVPYKTEYDGMVVSNARHYDALMKTQEALKSVEEGLKNSIPGELLAIDLREALYQLGLITGEVTTDDLLENIFRNFCIGK